MEIKIPTHPPLTAEIPAALKLSQNREDLIITYEEINETKLVQMKKINSIEEINKTRLVQIEKT